MYHSESRRHADTLSCLSLRARNYMAIDRRAAEPAKSLFALAKENELIIKPFRAGRSTSASSSSKLSSEHSADLRCYRIPQENERH